MQLSKAIDLFLGEQIETTRLSYYYVLRAMRDFVGPARPLEDVRSKHLIEYVQTVRKRSTVKSDATYNKHIKTIRTFFNWCVKASFVDSSPARPLKIIRHPKLIDRKKAMPDDLYTQLVDFAKWTPRYHGLVVFLGDTGCRIGGAAGLKWADVDLNENSALVTEKGRPARPVFYGNTCKMALIRWQLQHTGRDGDYVFQKHGRRMKNNSLGQLFERIGQRAGIGQWGPHSLRHRKGHALADQRTAPTLAAKLLGHASPLVTLESYYPDDWGHVREEAEKLHQHSADDPKEIINLPGKFGGT